jgi:hypothetical protein
MNRLDTAFYPWKRFFCKMARKKRQDQCQFAQKENSYQPNT